MHRAATALACFCVACSIPTHNYAQAEAENETISQKADVEKFFQKRVTPFIKTYNQNDSSTDESIATWVLIYPDKPASIISTSYGNTRR